MQAKTRVVLVCTAHTNTQGDAGLMEQFLHDPEQPDNLLKGPWLEIKLLFRTASSTVESPLSHVELSFAPYMHQQRLTDLNERALFHVAATRAVRYLYISSHGTPSAYLKAQ